MLRLNLPNLKYHGINSSRISNEQKIRIAKHYRDNPHAWWVPTGGQEDFLKNLEKIGTGRPGHRCSYALLSGGNCVGKTATEVNIINGLLQSRIYNPWIEKSKFFTDKSWSHGFGENGRLAILALMKKRVIKDVFTPEMKKWTPKGTYHTERSDEKYDYIWEFNRGGVLRLFTTEQNIGQLEGGNYDVILTDEHFPFNFFDELDQRLRGRGCWLIFQTPKYAQDSALLFGKLADMPEEERIIQFMHKESACKTHGVRGFRDHADIYNEIKKCRSPEQYACRVEGKPMAYVGKVFKQFSYDLNVISEEESIELVRKSGATLYASCDPAEARLNAIAWAVVLPDNRIIWIDEWPNWDPGSEANSNIPYNSLQYWLLPQITHLKDIKERMSPNLFCDIVKAKEAVIKAKYGLVSHVRFIDRIFTSRTPIGAKMTLRAQYAMLGVPFHAAEAEQELGSGHNRIRDLLSAEYDDLGGMIKPPQMLLCENNRNQIYSLANICYKVETKQGEYTGNLSQKVDATDPLKDFIDVTRFLVQKNPYYVPPTKDESKNIQYSWDGRRQTPYKNNGVYQGI